MSDVLSMAELIFSNADNVSTILIIAVLIAAFAIGIAEYKGNRQEALRYLDIAWKKVRGSKDMRTVHIVVSNRIV